jgi:hypothetical protein
MRKLVVAAIVAPLALAACAGSAESPSGGEAADIGARLAPAPVEEGAPRMEAASLPELAPAVIKEARLEVEVEAGAFDGAVDSATDVARRYDGYVLSSSVEGEDARLGTIELRVPADSFEAALDDLRGLGTPLREAVSGDEVGQEFVDLQARVRNARAQQSVLLRLMNDATTISSTIQVQRELEGVQLEIEQLLGRLRFLRDRTALSTIEVRLAEVGAPTTPGVFSRAWGRATGLFLGVVSWLIVALGFVAPLAVLGGIALLVVRRMRARPAASG